MFTLKRIYEPAAKSDGYRVLVDRLWPRGVSKAKASVDLWLKDIAPSNELRRWFKHDPKKWTEFQKRYIVELKKNTEAVNTLKAVLKKEKTVTLVYGAKDEEYNQAVLLCDFISK